MVVTAALGAAVWGVAVDGGFATEAVAAGNPGGGEVVAKGEQAAMSDGLSEPTRELLRSSDYIYTATRRKNGDRSSIAPVWFYYVGGDKLFFTTSPGSWKAKRLAAGSPLYVWVGEKDGPYLIGDAHEVTDAELIDRMGAAYSEKYWIAWMGFFRPRSDRVGSGKTVAYMVELKNP